MKLKLDVTPDLAALMAAEIKAGERAVTTAMREAGGQLKTDWRRQITGAGLGQRLAKSIRAETWPKGTTSIGAAALVWSKAPAIVGAHDTGPLIRSKTGFWLAIPTPAAGRGLRGGKITPGEWERRRGLRLRFVYRRRGPSLLVADRARINKRGQAVASRAKTGRNQVTAPIFLLVPQVKLPKRLDLDRDAERAHRQRAGADRGELGGGAEVTGLAEPIYKHVCRQGCCCYDPDRNVAESCCKLLTGYLARPQNLSSRNGACQQSRGRGALSDLGCEIVTGDICKDSLNIVR